MSITHLISGLGADRTAFSNLGEFTKSELNYIDWISNFNDESLQSYVKRLIDINTVKTEDTLIGLSFGGLVAQEMARQLNIKTVILISSFRDKNDLKPIFGNLLKLGLHNLIPNIKMNSLNIFVRTMFNTLSVEGQNLLNEMLDKTDIGLTKWSIQKIEESDNSLWEQIEIHNIIGDSDKLVKNWTTKNKYEIKGGGHFMVFENAMEITTILKRIFIR